MSPYFVNDTDDEHWYLWAKDDLQFLPNMPVVGLSVSGDENGASIHARELYLQLKERYSDMTREIMPEFFSRSDVRFNQKHNINNKEDYFAKVRLKQIAIDEAGDEHDLELGFRLPPDPEHIYITYWKAWRMIGEINVDG